jgi:solute carrier family 25 (adenine nucleotide translocator) protein 4/5/6/31
MEELAQDFISTSLIKTVFAPLERYKLVRQTQDILTLSIKEKSTNFFSFTSKSLSQEGLRGLFRSNMTAIYMWFPQVLA